MCFLLFLGRVLCICLLVVVDSLCCSRPLFSYLYSIIETRVLEYPTLSVKNCLFPFNSVSFIMTFISSHSFQWLSSIPLFQPVELPLALLAVLMIMKSLCFCLCSISSFSLSFKGQFCQKMRLLLDSFFLSELWIYQPMIFMVFWLPKFLIRNLLRILLKITHIWWVASSLLLSKFSLCLYLSVVWLQWLSVLFFVSSSYTSFIKHLGYLCSCFSLNFGKFYAIISSNLSLLFSPSFPLTPMMCTIVCLYCLGSAHFSLNFFSFSSSDSVIVIFLSSSHWFFASV